MELNKLQRYNQKLLAVIGTLIAALGAIGLITLIISLIGDITRNRNSDNNTGLLADEVTSQLTEVNQRQQIVSYDMPLLVDTPNLIYIVPVSQKNLDGTEDIEEEEVLGILDYRSKFGSGKRYSGRGLNGAHNNLLIYDQKTKEIIRLFDSRVFIGRIAIEYFENDILLVFRGVRFDSDKNGILNLNDYNSLFMYSIFGKNLKEISVPKMDVLAYQFVEDKKDVIIRFGVDRDENGKYESTKEPGIPYFYEFSNDTLVRIVPEDLNKKLQEIIQGSK